MSLQKYDQLPFLHSLYVEGKKKVGINYNGRCGICGDSQKSKSKRRLWFLIDKNPDTIIVYCHNCGYSSNLRDYIKHVDPLVFAEYQKAEKEQFLKDLREGKINQKQKNIEQPIITNTSLKYQFNLNPKYFKPAKDYKEAVEFCKSRKIIDKIENLYYNINSKSVLGGMLIFPSLLEDNKTLYGFSGRSIKDKRFHVCSPNSSFKSFGVFQVDKTKPIVVVESIIDSLNIYNAIAMVGADLTSGVKQYFKDCNLIMAPDFDKTGLAKSIKYCEEGYSVFVWPSSLHKIKDFNDISMKLNWTPEQITNLIKENTFKGLELKTKLAFKQLEKLK